MNEIHSEISGHRVKVLEDGGILLGHIKLYTYDTAITANSTATTLAAGTFGATSHATGRDKLFVSDGAKWQNFSPGTAVADTVAAAAAATAAALVDNSGGTGNGTVAAVEGTYTQATLANNFADVVAQINKLVVDVADIRTQLNLALTKLKAAGLMAT